MEEKQTLLRQFSIILSIYFLGELMQKTLGLPIPGNVIGMLLLFFGLYMGIIKLEMIDRISDFLLENLAFFFLPAAISLMTSFSLLEGKWTSILEISLISTIIILVVTGITVEIVKKLINRNSEIGCSRKNETHLSEAQKDPKNESKKVHV